jgi:hypothetical protein
MAGRPNKANRASLLSPATVAWSDSSDQVHNGTPKRNGQYDYRIKSTNELRERVMREIELLITCRS